MKLLAQNPREIFSTVLGEQKNEDSNFIINQENSSRIAYENSNSPRDYIERKEYKYFVHRWNSKKQIKINLFDLSKSEYELPIQQQSNWPHIVMHEIPNRGIFCFENRKGGHVFLIHQDNSIENLSNRHNLSEGSSAIYHKDFIYLFGGINKSNQALVSERYNFMKSKWEIISSPLAFPFNISGFGINQKIIFHEQNSGLLGIYDITTDSYSELYLPLVYGEYKELFSISLSVFLFEGRSNLLETNIEGLYDGRWKIVGNISPCMSLIGSPVYTDNSIYFLFLIPTLSLYKFDFVSKTAIKVKDFMNN
ncbi:unnamed protein product [Blepharisma stoltei]|uniref:Kelch repeat-containing protein n=1 Tax=Blepharisma stoltei TaxID=1481888 RepID=A0AAU9K1B3_9CILI|nr:unnamed protein product [Blepharisma stoltei]